MEKFLKLTFCDIITSLSPLKPYLEYRAQLFEGRLALNPGLNLIRLSFSCVQKYFLG